MWSENSLVNVFFRPAPFSSAALVSRHEPHSYVFTLIIQIPCICRGHVCFSLLSFSHFILFTLYFFWMDVLHVEFTGI